MGYNFYKGFEVDKLAKKKVKDKETKKTGLKKTKSLEPKKESFYADTLRGQKALESIVRILKTTLDGSKKVKMALIGIKGIGYNLSVSICRTAKIDENKLLKELTKTEIEKIEDIVNNADKSLPEWMLNRRKDYSTKKTKHKYGPELTMQLREDVLRLRKIRAYRGIRHELGLPTRGQKTKNSFRKHGVVGVVKKKTNK